MRFTPKQLRAVYARTSGYCHICYRKLALDNYGKRGERGAWHVDHSNPRAKGGTDRLNNLYPACIDCNIDKGARTTRAARGSHGTMSLGTLVCRPGFPIWPCTEGSRGCVECLC